VNELLQRRLAFRGLAQFLLGGQQGSPQLAPLRFGRIIQESFDCRLLAGLPGRLKPSAVLLDGLT
jgi:hypothetical protein